MSYFKYNLIGAGNTRAKWKYLCDHVGLVFKHDDTVCNLLPLFIFLLC